MTSNTFHKDELTLCTAKKYWTLRHLLRQEGMFYLKDVADLFCIGSIILKKHSKALTAEGKDPYAVMGARKILGQWMLRMSVFGPYYCKHLTPIDTIPEKADANSVLQLKGVYQLADIVRFFPFTSYDVKTRAKKHRNPRKQIGVWKNPGGRTYLVDMKIFGPFVVKEWRATA